MILADFRGKLIWIFLFTMMGGMAMHAQQRLFSMEHFGLEEGLPARMTYQMAQDRDGYIWISTQWGIHRFDGRKFVNFRNSELGLFSSLPARISVDTDNRLWYAGTKDGTQERYLGIIDVDGQGMIPIGQLLDARLAPRRIINFCKPHPGTKGMMLLADDGSLYHFDQAMDRVGKFELGGLHCNYALVAGSMPGEFWLHDCGRLHHLQAGHATQSYPVPVPKGAALEAMTLHRGEPIFWYAAGRRRFASKLSLDTFPSPAWPSLPWENIDQVVEFGHDFYALILRDSMVMVDADWNRLAAFAAFGQLPQNNPRSLHTPLVDKQGNFWFPAEDGVYKISMRHNPFTVLLPGTSVYGLLPQGPRLWAGGTRGCLYHDLQTGKKVPGQFQPVPTTYCQAADGAVWIAGDRHCLYRFNPTDQSLKEYDLGVNVMMTVPYQDRETGQLWLGTNHGPRRVVVAGDSARLVATTGCDNLQDMLVRAFHRNAAGLWVAGSRGILLLDPLTGACLRAVTTQEGLPYADLNHLHEDKAGNFWLATRGGGLIYWDLQAHTFQRFTRENGLSNDNLYAVYQDDHGTLWLPSDYGLMAFDIASSNVRTYHLADGIANEEFNTYSHYKAADGTLYLGGLGGVTRFHPNEVRAEAYVAEPTLQLSRVRVLRAGEETGEDFNLTAKSAREIILAPGDQMMELDFSYLDFDHVSSNRIAYRLLGYRDQWVYPDELSIHLLHLPYGSYTLQVRAYGASGRWTTKFLEIPIEVQAPFYRQTWFVLLMVLVLGIVILLGGRLRIRVLQRDRMRLEVEVQKRTETIAKQAEALQALDQAKSRFFANITHEIRTPLTLVIGPLEQIMQSDAPPPLRERLGGVLRNARSLLGLINQLLDISKLENSQMQVELSHGSIVGFTRELLDAFAPLAEPHGIRLHFHSQASEWEVAFDADKWIKIVSNLVSNAIKFTEPGGEVEVVLSKESDGKATQAVLAVRDTGIGIPEAEIDNIFDRFFQVDGSSTRLQAGTGIGLALVKELVELQGGTIRVESAVGVGTSFWVRIPVKSDVEAAQRNLPTLDPIENWTAALGTTYAAPLPCTGQLELLLVEDNAEMRQYIRSCIDASKYKVTEAANGEEGLRIALERVPDLIISDVMMPIKDGFELTRDIRAHVATSHIPLILLTAKTSLESKLTGLRRGADAYLTKPFSPAELCTQIDQLIELRKLLQTRYRMADRPEQVGARALVATPEFQQEDQFMAHLRRYLDDNLDDPDLNVAKIAAHFQMSRTQLYRKLASLTETGVTDLIRSARCERALELIRRQELNLSEIAYEVGYSSPSHFSRSFKQQFGLAPSDVLRNA